MCLPSRRNCWKPGWSASMSETSRLLRSPFAAAFLTIAIPVADLALRTRGYRPSATPATPLPTTGDVSRNQRERGETYVSIGKRVGALWSRIGGNGTCLRQAIAVRWLLDACGIPVDVVLGIRIDATPPAAHAWLTYNGVALAAGDAGCAPLKPAPAPNRGLHA